MSGWAESKARDLRKTHGPDLEALEAALEPAILCHDTERAALCVHYGRDEADVFSPRGNRRKRAHELGHACCTMGAGRWMKRRQQACWRIQLLRDEAIACRFAATFLGDD